MDCRDVTERLAPYLESELAPAEIELLERHLDTCAECRARVERLAEQDLAPPPVAPELQRRMAAPDFWGRMDARLAEEMEALAAVAPEPERAPLSIGWRGIVAFAAALVLALLWGAHNHHEVQIARAEAESLARQLDRAERLAEVPGQRVEPAAGTRSARTVAGSAHVSSDELELAGYTPHRSTF